MTDLFNPMPPPAKPRPPQKPKATPVEHRCDAPGCVQWGAFGTARRGRPTRWLCQDHRVRKAGKT